MLSASLVGILFGSMLFGWIDRFGRKKAALGSLFLFGIFTWIAAHATNLTQVGGALPGFVSALWVPRKPACEPREADPRPFARLRGARRGALRGGGREAVPELQPEIPVPRWALSILIRWLDRYPFVAISVLFVIAVPVVGALGCVGVGSTKAVLLPACFVAGLGAMACFAIYRLNEARLRAQLTRD